MLIAALRSFHSYCCAFHKPDSSADFALHIVASISVANSALTYQVQLSVAVRDRLIAQTNVVLRKTCSREGI